MHYQQTYSRIGWTNNGKIWTFSTGQWQHNKIRRRWVANSQPQLYSKIASDDLLTSHYAYFVATAKTI